MSDSENFVLRRFAKMVNADVSDCISSMDDPNVSPADWEATHAKRKKEMLDLLRHAGALPPETKEP